MASHVKLGQSRHVAGRSVFQQTSPSKQLGFISLCLTLTCKDYTLSNQKIKFPSAIYYFHLNIYTGLLVVVVYYRQTVSMGRTKSQSRSSSSSSTRSVPYDMNIPENKTIAQLKVELSHRGIEFPSNAKKSQLLRLWKTYIMKTTSRPIPGQITEPAPLRHDTLPEVPPEARDLLVTSQEEASQNSPLDGSKHGD